MLAILCSGQGGQHPGMFDLLCERAEAVPVLEAAARWLGADPRDLVRDAAADLYANRTGQILCCAQALAAWATLAPGRPACVVVGYSIGDLAAWGCAGHIDPATIFDLAVYRAEAMDAASGSRMGLAGIRGLSRAQVERLLAKTGLHIAIINAEDSFVIGGDRAALGALCVSSLAAGARRAVILPVRTPSHTPLLAAAAEPFANYLKTVAIGAGLDGVRLLSGLDGVPVFDARADIAKLAVQIASVIDWAACLTACGELGATRILELGPGDALATMARAALPQADTRALQDFRGIEGVRAWLAAA